MMPFKSKYLPCSVFAKHLYCVMDCAKQKKANTQCVKSFALDHSTNLTNTHTHTKLLQAKNYFMVML